MAPQPAGTPLAVYGIASAGDRGIARVEVSADGGKTYVVGRSISAKGELGPLFTIGLGSAAFPVIALEDRRVVVAWQEVSWIRRQPRSRARAMAHSNMVRPRPRERMPASMRTPSTRARQPPCNVSPGTKLSCIRPTTRPSLHATTSSLLGSASMAAKASR